MRPPAELLDRLTSYRLLAGAGKLSARQGERRSNVAGVGMEFAGSRPYQEGDDLRRLDSHLYARHRKPFVREHLADRQLRVAVLVDTSPSMQFGTPSKWSTATMLASLLSYAALSSGDLVEVGLAQPGRIAWSDALQGSSRAETLFRWLDKATPGAAMPFEQQMRLALPRLTHANLVILISDWWLEEPARQLLPLAELGAVIFALSVAAPEEEDPLLLGRGPVRLRDSESDTELNLAIDPAQAAEYGKLLEQHRQSLVTELKRFGGQFLALRSDLQPGELFTRLVKGRLLGQVGATREV
jgi:uncharacterized protein (DUF58 family)